MRENHYPGGWYIDALPTGEQAVMFPLLGRVETHTRVYPFTPGDGPLYLCITNVPTFQFAGQANTSPGTWYMRDGEMKLDPRVSYGTFGAIFDLNGVLRTIEHVPGEATTSQGYRYVAPDGRLVLGDETILLNGVHSYTDLGGGILVGQGMTAANGVVIWDGTHHRELHAGMCYAIRARRVGDDVSVAFYDVDREGLEAHIYRGKMSEFLALPIQSAPIHNDAPHNDVPHNDTPEPTMTPNRLDVIQALAVEHRHLLTTNTKASVGLFTEIAFDRLHSIDADWGLLSKSPGENQWNGHAVDAGIYRRTQQVIDILGNAGAADDEELSAEERKQPATPTWIEQPKRSNNNWMLPVPVVGSHNDVPHNDVHSDAPHNDAPREDISLSTLAKIMRRLDALEAPHSVTLESNRHRYMRDNWGDDTARFDRDEPGPGETFTMRIIK